MKLNFKKLLNPSNIDFKELKKMTPEQQIAYLKEINKSNVLKMWGQLTYTVNYLNLINTWQYIVALWVM